MRDIFKFGIILGTICVVAAGLLAGVNSITSREIILRAQAEEELS